MRISYIYIYIYINQHSWTCWSDVDDTPGTPDPYEMSEMSHTHDRSNMSVMTPTMIPMYSVNQCGAAPCMMLVPVASNSMQNFNFNFQQSSGVQNVSEE